MIAWFNNRKKNKDKVQQAKRVADQMRHDAQERAAQLDKMISDLLPKRKEIYRDKPE